MIWGRCFDRPVCCIRCGRDADAVNLCGACDVRDLVNNAETRASLVIAEAMSRIYGVSYEYFDRMVHAASIRTPGRMH
jgi:hypothetical protein